MDAKFSFIFACGGDDIKAAVDALLRQNRDDIQILLADGSEDSLEKCLESAGGDYIVFAGKEPVEDGFVDSLRSAVEGRPDVALIGKRAVMSPSCIAAGREFLEERGIEIRVDKNGYAPEYVFECLERCGVFAQCAGKPAKACGDMDVRSAARAYLRIQHLWMNSAKRDELAKTAADFCGALGEMVYRGYAHLTEEEKKAFDWKGLEAEGNLADIICEMYLKKLRTFVYNKVRPQYTKEIYELDRQARATDAAIDALQGSISYRIGRLITKPFRRILRKKDMERPVYEKLGDRPVMPYIRDREEDFSGIINEIISRAGAGAEDMHECTRAEYDPERPMVSVVLPMYNVERYVGHTYATLKVQTLRNFEMIFVDDGSTDRSPEMVEEYAAADPRVKLVRQENQFAGVARNTGLKHARGKYVCFLDPDDFFEARLLEKCYAAAEEHGADVTMFSADIYNQKEKFLYRAYYLELASRMPQGRAFASDEIMDNVFMLLNPWTKFYNRQFAIDNGLKYQALYSSNDAHFTMMAMATARRICAVPDVLVHYRINRSGSLQATKGKNPRNVYEAFYGTKAELEKRGLFEKFRLPFIRKAMESMLRSLEDIRDFEATKGFYEFLRGEGLENLGIHAMKADDFAYENDRTRFERIRRILKCSFEEYMFAERLALYDELQTMKAWAAKK